MRQVVPDILLQARIGQAATFLSCLSSSASEQYGQSRIQAKSGLSWHPNFTNFQDSYKKVWFEKLEEKRESETCVNRILNFDGK